MATLAAHLARAFPGLSVSHIKQGCSFAFVTGRGQHQAALNHRAITAR